jgi:CheY-like chemotaxis protein
MDNLILILDDSITRQQKFLDKLDWHNDVYFADNAQDAISLLEKYLFDWAYLDHDLGGDTGYDVALWLNQNQDRMPKNIVIHSLNPVGAKRMKGVLPQAQVIPCAWNYL